VEASPSRCQGLQLEPRKTGLCTARGLHKHRFHRRTRLLHFFLGTGIRIGFRFTRYSRSCPTIPSASPCQVLQLDRKNRKDLDRIKSLGKDPFILTALSSIVLGGLLNWSGVQRPEFSEPSSPPSCSWNHSPAHLHRIALKFRKLETISRSASPSPSSSSYLFLSGLSWLTSWLRKHRKRAAAQGGDHPLLHACCLQRPDSPSIYDFGPRSCHSCWFFTTSLLVLVLPLLFLIVNTFNMSKFAVS